MNGSEPNGFTLLELLLVLFIFSLLAGLALPRFFTASISVQNSGDRDEALMQLADIGFKVNQRGLGGVILTAEELKQQQLNQLQILAPTDPLVRRPLLPYTLPVGWFVTAEQPVHYLANGVCLGGTVYLSCPAQNITLTVRLEKPYCQPQVVQ